MNIYERIGQRIEGRLKNQNFSAEKLAFKTGLSKPYVYRILSGERHPSIETLEKIARGLEVPIEELIKEE